MSIGEYRIEAFPLQFALYLEGVRVPFVNATVTAAPNRPTVCTIGLPPFASALRLRPRTLVDLFYLDSPFVNQKLVDDQGNVNSNPDPDTWRLLFSGEMSHHEVEETATGRTVNLICLDMSNYWHHVYQYFINNQRGMAGAPVEIASFVNGFNSSTGDPLVDLTTIYNLTLPGSGADDIVLSSILGGRRNTIMAGLADLLVRIGGEASHIGVNDPKGVNRFFRDAERRLRLARRTFFVPDLQLANFMRLKADFALKRLLNQATGELGALGTVNDVVKRFQAHAFYDYVNFPAPPYGPNPSRDIRDDGLTEEVDLPMNLSLDFTRSVILGTMLKPKTFFLPPPRCNVMFPSQVTRFSYSKSYLDEPTRLRLKISHGLSGRNVPFETNSIQELAVYAPPQTILNSPNPLITESDDTTEARSEQEDGNLAAWQDVVREYGFYTDGSNLNFDPTREISEPETGIVPVFDTMDIVQAANIAELVAAGSNPETDTIQSKLATLIGSVSDQNTPFGDDPDNENARNVFRYYLASANYQLDLRRYAQRAVRGIEGPFNPRLLVGFPAALLNSTCIVLGELTSVSHMIGQEGVRTSASITHARNFPIPSFLSALSPDQLAAIAFTFGGSNSFRNDPVTGDRVSTFKSPIDGSDVEFQDRNARDVPSFLNNKFTSPTRIHNEVYVPIFDTTSIFRRVSAAGGSLFESGSAGEADGDQYAAAVAQYVDYLRAPDKTAFVNFATKRNIATIDNVRAHYDNFATFRPVPQEEWHLLGSPGYTGPHISGGDEFLYGGPGIGPVFKALNGFTASKQESVRALTKDMRIALGKQPGVNFPDDIDTNHHRAGGVSGS